MQLSASIEKELENVFVEPEHKVEVQQKQDESKYDLSISLSDIAELASMFA